MATIIRDTFNPYGQVSDAAQNFWDIVDSVHASLSKSTLRYPTDVQSLQITTSNGNVILQKGSTNDTTCYAFFAFITNQSFAAGGGSLYFVLYDTGTPQCCVEFTTVGTIYVRSGGTTGTVIATFTSAWSQQQWNGWNIQVVIDPSNGSVAIRKNGSSTNTFSATGLNTRGGTSNSYANQYAIYAGLTAYGQFVYNLKDVWFYNSSGAAPNTFLSGDMRTGWLAPVAPSQTQFTPSSIPTFGPSSTSSTQSITSNLMFTGPSVSPLYNGTVATVSLQFNASATGHAIVGIYDNTGANGGPGALIATSTAVTNPGSGSVNFTFSSPPKLSNLLSYYLAVLADVGVVLKAGGTSSGYSVAQAYGSGFPNPALASSIGSIAIPAATVTYASNNYTCVSELNEDGSSTTVSSSTASNEDRYGISPLPYTPTAIYGIQLRGFMQKSDSGARTGAMTVTSSANNVVGSSVALTTTFENVTFNQDTDPATATAWTPSGLNAALVGVKVVA